MFDQFEEIVKDFVDFYHKWTNRFKKVFIKLLWLLFWVAIVIGMIMFVDWIKDETLNFNFMSLIYNLGLRFVENTNWSNVLIWIMTLILNGFYISFLILILPTLFIVYIESKDKVVFLSNPTKTRFLKLMRNFLVFFVFFLAAYSFVNPNSDLEIVSVLYGFMALVVTLIEDRIHKRRIPYIRMLEEIATEVIKLSDYFSIESTFISGYENREERAIIVSRVVENKKELAIEYFTKHPVRSKILLVPNVSLEENKIKYFSKVLNNMKLEFQPDKFKEFKIRVFKDSKLYEHYKYINYDYLSGDVRNKYLIQDVYYDIKHYILLEQNNTKKEEDL